MRAHTFCHMSSMLLVEIECENRISNSDTVIHPAMFHAQSMLCIMLGYLSVHLINVRTCSSFLHIAKREVSG